MPDRGRPWCRPQPHLAQRFSPGQIARDVAADLRAAAARAAGARGGAVLAAAPTVELLLSAAKNETEATNNRALLAKNIGLSEKVATFVNVKGAEKFVAEFIVQLEKGKSVTDAITIAGKGKGKGGQDITEEQVRSCLKG